MNKTYNLNEAIEYFKEKTKDATSPIEVLMDNSQLRSAFIAWQSVRMKKKENAVQTHEYSSDLEMWEWIWDQYVIDLKKFGVISGIKEIEITDICDRLIGLKLIFPFGEVHKLAAQFVDSLIAKKIQTKRK